MGAIGESLFDAGRIEIATYVPATLLSKAPEEMDMDEFVEALAVARYIQELRATEVALGVSKLFSED